MESVTTTEAAETTPSSEASVPTTKESIIQGIVEKFESKEEAAPIAKEEVVTQEEPKEEKVSSKLAAIVAREAKLTEKAAELEAKEKELEARLSKVKGWKEDPLGVLEAADTTFEALAQAAIKHGEPESIEEKHAREVAELKARLDKKEQEEASAREAAEKQSIEGAITDYKTRLSTLIAEDATKETPEFELVAAYEAQDLVYDITEAYWNRFQKILTPSEAAAKAERFLEKRLDKVVNTKKVKSRLQPVKKATEKPTLTNNMQNFSAAIKETPALDRDARLERALSKLRYT